MLTEWNQNTNNRCKTMSSLWDLFSIGIRALNMAYHHQHNKIPRRKKISKTEYSITLLELFPSTADLESHVFSTFQALLQGP